MRQVVCQAARPEPAKQLGNVAAATILAAALSFTAVDAAKADIAGLTPCSQSKAYAKRQKNEIKGLNKRLKQVTPSALQCAATWHAIDQLESLPRTDRHRF